MKFKNKTDSTQVLPEIGVVKAGEIIETNVKIENSNFEEVKEGSKKNK